mgnify:CR=1 FL=1|jgi:hypothetical protein
MDKFNLKKFLSEKSLLNENAPGYDTRKSGEALPTLESVKAAYEAKNKKDKDKEPRDGVKSAASKLGMKPSHIKEGVWNMPSADELDEFVAYMEDAKERFYHIGSDDVHDGLESAITAAKQLLNMQLKEE